MIRVLLVVDVPFYRDGLQRLLAQDGEIIVVGQIEGHEAVAAAARERPDIVLLDIGPPGAGVWIKQLLRLPQPPRVVALAVNDAEESVVTWLEAGVAGYVSRHSSFTQLLQVLHSASRGECSCSPRVMSLVLRRLSALSAGARPTPPVAPLTMRERQILDLVATGLSNKRIAITLHISHATAKNHVHHILSKLHLGNRTEVAAYLNGVSQTPPSAATVRNAAPVLSE